MSARLPLPHLRLPDTPPAADEQPLGHLPLTVVVGVTGVGKSTALSALQNLGRQKVLPNRREVADAVMIWPQAGRAVTDREERFALTAQYRAGHPGGMAQALGSLLADTRHWGRPRCSTVCAGWMRSVTLPSTFRRGVSWRWGLPTRCGCAACWGGRTASIR
ncbi:hypothetical protein ACFP9V_09400 [Deinococcus radiopugnans]|uniref:hypothetical protein n=1 Tax=Deinococcus radiopugnans TaxID=57497 RepID=UPI00361DA5EC